MKITIARECGCYGDEVGQVLADRLNVPLYNKKTLTELAKKKGILEHYPDYFGENPAGTLLAVIAEDDGRKSPACRLGSVSSRPGCRKDDDGLPTSDSVFSEMMSQPPAPIPESGRCPLNSFSWMPTSEL